MELSIEAKVGCEDGKCAKPLGRLEQDWWGWLLGERVNALRWNEQGEWGEDERKPSASLELAFLSG